MLFTPMLAASAVGTVEYQSITEVREEESAAAAQTHGEDQTAVGPCACAARLIHICCAANSRSAR